MVLTWWKRGRLSKKANRREVVAARSAAVPSPTARRSSAGTADLSRSILEPRGGSVWVGDVSLKPEPRGGRIRPI